MATDLPNLSRRLSKIEVEQMARFWTATRRVMLWKSGVVERYRAAVLTVALVMLEDGVTLFGPSDVPDEFHVESEDVDGGESKSRSIAGIVWKDLHTCGLIEPYFGNHPDRKILYGQRTSRRRDRNGAKERLYRLVGDGSLARAWLAKNGWQVPERKQQRELVGV